jgi:hypothetical protein
MLERISVSTRFAAAFRLFRLLIGNVALILLSAGVFLHSQTAPFHISIAYWALISAMLAAKYAEIRLSRREAADDEDETMIDLWRYAINLLLIALPIFISAFFLGREFR